MDGRHPAMVVTCLLLLLSAAATQGQDASRITEVHARIRVLPNLFSQEEVKATYEGVAGSTLGDEYRIPGEVLDLEVRDSQGGLDFTKRRSGNITIVRFFFRTALGPGDEEEVTFSYRSSNFTSKFGTVWSYSTVFLASAPVDSWSAALEIPGSIELYPPSGAGFAGLSRILQNEDSTLCEWRASNQDSLVIAMAYSPIERSAESRLLLYLGLAGVFAVIMLAAYLARTFYPERKEFPKAAEIAVKILEDRERRIVRELAGGANLTQAELVKATKLSKATVSRAVVELERRRVVARERSGRVVRVKLQDWILET